MVPIKVYGTYVGTYIKNVPKELQQCKCVVTYDVLSNFSVNLL
jgi:hypothetical protein